MILQALHLCNSHSLKTIPFTTLTFWSDIMIICPPLFFLAAIDFACETHIFRTTVPVHLKPSFIEVSYCVHVNCHMLVSEDQSSRSLSNNSGTGVLFNTFYTAALILYSPEIISGLCVPQFENPWNRGSMGENACL